MLIHQVINELIKEKQNKVTSRFPCRVIMVKNVQQYGILLSSLKKIPDIAVVPSEVLFSSADVMPRYENLIAEENRNKWLILPGVSEYLRLFSKSEAATQRFAKLWASQVPASSLGRILIPLWGCEAQWHDKLLHLCDDIRQDGFYYDCIDDTLEEQSMNLIVLSGDFETYIFQLQALKGHMCIGLKEWYEYWAEPHNINNEELLLTRRYSSIQNVSGNISVKVIRDTFSFVKENLSGANQLTEENCPKEAQTLLFDAALRGKTLDNAILSSLNIASFSGIDVMSKWATIGLAWKQLIFLWFDLHPDDTYLCYSIKHSNTIDELESHFIHDIFSVYSSHSGWVDEFRRILEVTGFHKDEQYYDELDKIAVYEERLQFLTRKEKSDRVYLLHLVGKWMREDSKQTLGSEILKEKYPELHAYLSRGSYDDDLNDYFVRYKIHKLENSLPQDEELFFSNINPDLYEYRYAYLSDMIDEDCIVLWIDALGAEWLPLLEWVLSRDEYGIVVATAVVQAFLPSETSFNDQWNQMQVIHKKLDRLDKLAHKGVIDDPDYYSCIEEQITFISEIRKTIDLFLKEYHRVIITGDHGTSRLAARFFHKRDGAMIPKGAIVCSHGRYCQITKDTVITQPNVVRIKASDGNYYAVFNNYDHFKKSGFATGNDDEKATYGEIHGGATPEEMLVPVVVFDSKKEKPLTANWQSNKVKISGKKVKVKLCFNKPVYTLQAEIGSVSGKCEATDDNKIWYLTFPGILPGLRHVSIAADGVLVHVEDLNVESALGDGDGDLP